MNFLETGGSFVIANTDTHTGHFIAIKVVSATVFNALLDENGDSVLSAQGLTGVTIPADTVLIPQGKNFGSIDLTSGTVVAYYR